jgi:uncharacterized membrane protein
MITNNVKEFFKSDKKYFLLVLICFLYAGFALISFTFTVYAGTNMSVGPSDMNIIRDNNDFNFPLNGKGIGRRGADPFQIMFGATAANFLAGGIISLLSGGALASLLRKKEKKQMTHKLTNDLLLPNEKKIYSLLANAPSGLTQSKLTLESGLSKVQVHRFIKKLEDKGLIEKHKYGATNKLFLKNKD